jgi:hypothetical protein
LVPDNASSSVPNIIEVVTMLSILVHSTQCK